MQDVAAERQAVRAGFKSRSAVVLGSGEDPEEVNAQIQADNAVADAAGLVFDSDARRTNNTGTSQSTDPDPAADSGEPGNQE